MILTKLPTIVATIVAVVGCDFAFITETAAAVSIKFSEIKNLSIITIQKLEARYQKSFGYKVLDKIEKSFFEWRVGGSDASNWGRLAWEETL